MATIDPRYLPLEYYRCWGLLFAHQNWAGFAWSWAV